MKLSIKEIAVFGMLGAMMFASKMLMEFLPNVHLLGVFTIAFTVVYRQKALYPIYIYVLLNGIVAGFNLWWVPHLYIWTVLWGAVMLLPKNMPKKAKPFVYSGLCGLHGFLYGILYAPSQALFYGLSFDATIAWIVSGLPFDLIHGISNIVCGVLICPIIMLLRKAEKFIY